MSKLDMVWKCGCWWWSWHFSKILAKSKLNGVQVGQIGDGAHPQDIGRQDGQDGQVGQDGQDGQDRPDGTDGKDGKDRQEHLNLLSI